MQLELLLPMSNGAIFASIQILSSEPKEPLFEARQLIVKLGGPGSPVLRILTHF